MGSLRSLRTTSKEKELERPTTWAKPVTKDDIVIIDSKIWDAKIAVCGLWFDKEA
jgi:hypothetical protein